MYRTLVLPLMVVLSLSAQAQGREITPRETPQMKAKATERTELVHKTVSLSNEQRERVYEAFLEVERYHDAVLQRYQGQPQEVIDADLPAQYENMDWMADQKLVAILNEQQYRAWKQAFE